MKRIMVIILFVLNINWQFFDYYYGYDVNRRTNDILTNLHP